MAGRGRGQSQSHNRVLEMIGVDRSEIQRERQQGGAVGVNAAGAVTPAPVYSPLLFKPLPLREATSESEYKLMLLGLFMERMRSSRFAIHEEKMQSEIERYSDRYRLSMQEDLDLGLDWENFPAELWPHNYSKSKSKKRKKCASEASTSAGVKTKKQPGCVAANLDRRRRVGETDEEMRKRLQDLEDKEKAEGVEKEEEEGGDEDEEDDEGGAVANKDVDVEEEVEDEDEELDEGTDYRMDYFDNGESYAVDEDDALDDEGAY